MSIEVTSQSNLVPLKIEAYKDSDCLNSINKSWSSDFSPLFKDFVFSIDTPELMTPLGVDSQNHGFSRRTSTFNCEIEIQQPFNDSYSEEQNYVLNKFNDLINLLQYDGSLHSEPFYKLTCGEIEYKTKLRKYKIIEERYSNTRKLIYIKISLLLQQVESVELEMKRKNLQSPDVTHYYLVKDGDNLLKISNDMYGSTSYYIQIARYNNLKSIRNLKVGSRLVLPALAK